MSLEQTIISEAIRIGFASCGITKTNSSETIILFKQWLAGGNAAEMGYLKRNIHLRSDIRNLMPETRSIIIVAARYPSNKSPGKGFSTYAGGKDYHKVIRGKLTLLLEFIKKRISVDNARICVDSAPVLERELAIQAGIGWRGKQGQIVNPQFGCCFVLGELLLNLELQPTAKLTNQCGACRKCLDNCPTGAITENGLLDCRKCLSYLTIEHKGEIPRESQALLGKTVFGCDICTAVCPWNRAGNEQVMPELQLRKMPTIEEIIQMAKVEFNQRFKDTTIYRTGLESLKRNASIALKNS
ncbi:MAG: tRNA epoxyqueuosine(34) reductase QueG [Kiritimatiellae bacterium]|nr:tRNA epoxyqueuosine(34) reductase QueG [Kiritimatiellia bacterium]MDD5521495.1 tRNA epoxyqueuosine(34) reductase QueG [Kiritimatiellia bacterium]